MKRTIITLMLAGAMMALTIPTALANSEYSNDSAGYTDTYEDAECRPAASNDLVSGWETMTQEMYEAERIDYFMANRAAGLSDEEIAYWVETYIPETSDATWAFCDKNLDGTLCVLRTEISPYYYTLLDNRPFQPASR
jgi:hypothetical protein